MSRFFFCFTSLLFVFGLNASDVTDYECARPPFNQKDFIDRVNSLVIGESLSEYWPGDNGEMLEMDRALQLSIAIEHHKNKVLDMRCDKVAQTNRGTLYFYSLTLNNGHIFQMTFNDPNLGLISSP